VSGPVPTLRLPAPAKLNLFLHVTGRRDDGYHLLESVFVPVSLADRVRLTLRADGEVHLLNAPAGLDRTTDLACRAARALQAHTGCALGADIELDKQIPQGAGMGGGSSDAATALLGLNRLWRLGLDRATLQQIGAGLGADVPFFVFGRPALARGIGEQLAAVTLPPLHAVVASPGAGVATAAVFTHHELRRDSAPLRHPVFAPGFGRNDLQAVAEALQPRIALLSKAMDGIALKPRMTGSGSCVFALTHSRVEAVAAASSLAAQGWASWAVHGLNQHPLHSFADGAII